MWGEHLSGILDDIVGKGVEDIEQVEKESVDLPKEDRDSAVREVRNEAARSVGEFARDHLAMSATMPGGKKSCPPPEGTAEADPESACATLHFETEETEVWEMLARILNQAMCHTCSAYCLVSVFQQDKKTQESVLKCVPSRCYYD